MLLIMPCTPDMRRSSLGVVVYTYVSSPISYHGNIGDDDVVETCC